MPNTHSNEIRAELPVLLKYTVNSETKLCYQSSNIHLLWSGLTGRVSTPKDFHSRKNSSGRLTPKSHPWKLTLRYFIIIHHQPYVAVILLQDYGLWDIFILFLFVCTSINLFIFLFIIYSCSQNSCFSLWRALWGSFRIFLRSFFFIEGDFSGMNLGRC